MQWMAEKPPNHSGCNPTPEWYQFRNRTEYLSPATALVILNRRMKPTYTFIHTQIVYQAILKSLQQLPEQFPKPLINNKVLTGLQLLLPINCVTCIFGKSWQSILWTEINKFSTLTLPYNTLLSVIDWTIIFSTHLVINGNSQFHIRCYCGHICGIGRSFFIRTV